MAGDRPLHGVCCGTAAALIAVGLAPAFSGSARHAYDALSFNAFMEVGANHPWMIHAGRGAGGAPREYRPKLPGGRMVLPALEPAGLTLTQRDKLRMAEVS